ncbi:hypothetical protein NDU88_005944 [Pleurodeles waltl]|uniref:Uncharacterized protein n=1 Tax=Pleurodeles waltl TaxID=8319 RepID=A0AAV7MCH5_PLEWA|nr:hypothetical protein NDU88_005944 [Pleurodeles waltl]
MTGVPRAAASPLMPQAECGALRSSNSNGTRGALPPRTKSLWSQPSRPGRRASSAGAGRPRPRVAASRLWPLPPPQYHRGPNAAADSSLASAPLRAFVGFGAQSPPTRLPYLAATPGCRARRLQARPGPKQPLSPAAPAGPLVACPTAQHCPRVLPTPPILWDALTGGGPGIAM